MIKICLDRIFACNITRKNLLVNFYLKYNSIPENNDILVFISNILKLFRKPIIQLCVDKEHFA